MTFLATSASAHTGPLPRWWSGPAYGLLGLPLAFVALPLYVVLPHHYATTLGLPLASVGALLMLVRLLPPSLTRSRNTVKQWWTA